MDDKIKLNLLLSLPPADFLVHIGGIYEKSPWVVERFYNDNLSPSLLDQPTSPEKAGRNRDVRDSRR